MAYQIYTTDALVCGTYRRNTADAAYALLTAEAGLVYATARSVREERSRQRYALQDFSVVRVSLVHGKAGWRIGSVDSATNFYHQATTRAQRGAVVQTVKIVRRFVPAEGNLPDIFAHTKAVLDRVATISDEDIPWLVRHYELWLLYTLGYIAKSMIPAIVSLDTPPAAWHSPPDSVQVQIADIIAAATTASQL